jgi:hypothetical protein
MENIPGIHIGDIGASVFDCNGNGKDELFSYGFYGRGNWIHIYGYDGEKNDIVDYCDDEIYFEIINNNKGHAPVEFTYHKNRNGFKVYSWFYSQSGRERGLYFYAWNSETRKYENLGEYEN